MYREGYNVQLFYLIPLRTTMTKTFALACLRKMQTRHFFTLGEEEQWWNGGDGTSNGTKIYMVVVEAREPFSEAFIEQERRIMKRHGGIVLKPGEDKFKSWEKLYRQYFYPNEEKER